MTGSITGNGAGWRTNINIMGCIIDAGDISLSNQYYGNIISNILNNGSINLSHGRIIGNELVNENRQILISNSTSIANDTLNIIANKVPSINCSSDIFLNIRNNFIKRLTTPPSYFASIYYAFNSGGINKLNIINNTILTPRINATGFDQVYYLNLSSPAVIKNNIFQRITSNATGNSPGYILTNNSVSYNFYYNISDAKMTVVLDVNSIDTDDAQRDGQLKSADFFDTEKYPTMTFVSTSFKKVGKSKTHYKLEGNLTLHGVTKKITLDAVYGGTILKDPFGNTKAGFKFTGKINRKDWGLIWNKTLDTGGLAIGNEVNLSANIEFLKSK